MAPYDTPIWTPSEDDLQRSSMAKFRDFSARKFGLTFSDYYALHAWSVDPKTAGEFWMTLFEFLEIGATVQPSRAFDPHNGKMFPTPEFFPDTRMNFAGSVLSNRNPSAIAIIEARENSFESNNITWGTVYSQVEKVADAMRSSGVVKGDRIAAVISNHQYSITICLAALSIGAIWSAISTDFGTSGILDRLTQIQPKLVFADDFVDYNGKHKDLTPIISEWAKVIARENSLRNVVLTPSTSNVDVRTISKGFDFNTFLSRGKGRKLVFEQLPFNHPGFIFYSSGTTGAPKCILHSTGGVLLQIKKDYILNTSILATDTLFQYTTTAWIMWAFVLTTLSIGTKIILYTGSPVYPDVQFLPKLLSKLKVTVLGTSAKYLTDLKDSGARPRDDVDLSSLRKVTSTGSVLPADVAEWFYEKGFPPQVQLISGSGGTDCSCAFVSGSPLLPVYADSIQSKVLGMAVDVYDCNSGVPKSIETTEEPGELVCTQPFPSQPLTFWGPKGSEIYKKSYFDMFGPSVWVQGDLIRIKKGHGGIQMLGRSDGVLNPSGVRFGSAEIYNVVRHFVEIEDSVCVGQRRPADRDERVLLFVKLKPGTKRTVELKDRLKSSIQKALSKRHVPKYVFYIDDIPHSLVGKKLEILVKGLVSGRKIASNVVANPASLEMYEKYFKLEEIVGDEDRVLSRL